MGMTFDATLKDLERDCPRGVLAEFDQPPILPVSVLIQHRWPSALRAAAGAW